MGAMESAAAQRVADLLGEPPEGPLAILLAELPPYPNKYLAYQAQVALRQAYALAWTYGITACLHTLAAYEDAEEVVAAEAAKKKKKSRKR